MFNAHGWLNELRDLLARLQGMADEFEYMADRLPQRTRHYPKAWAEDMRYLVRRVDMLIEELQLATGGSGDRD